MRQITFLILIILLLIPSSYALTASMGNARMVLRPEVPEGKTVVIEKTISVNNVNDFPIKIEITPDKYYAKIIEVLDNNFVLQPGDSKKAAFRITLKSGGTYSGKLLVSFKPEDPERKDIPMMLPSTIIIVASGPVNDNYYDVMGEDAETVEIPIADDENTADDSTDEDTADVNSNPTNKSSMSFIKSILTGIAVGLIIVLVILGIIIYKRRF